MLDILYRTTFFSVLPGVKPGAFLAAIVIFSPVFGLRPGRDARCRTLNVPKPVMTTFSPRFSESRTALRKEPTASLAALLVRFAFFATRSVRSFFVKFFHPLPDRKFTVNDLAKQYNANKQVVKEENCV